MQGRYEKVGVERDLLKQQIVRPLIHFCVYKVTPILGVGKGKSRTVVEFGKDLLLFFLNFLISR